jgi:hypothetical protein
MKIISLFFLTVALVSIIYLVFSKKEKPMPLDCMSIGGDNYKLVHYESVTLAPGSCGSFNYPIPMHILINPNPKVYEIFVNKVKILDVLNSYRTAQVIFYEMRDDKIEIYNINPGDKIDVKIYVKKSG